MYKISALRKITQTTWSLKADAYLIYATLINIILFNIPLFNFAIENLDLRSLNGLVTLLNIFIVLFMFSVLFLGLSLLISTYLTNFILISAALINSTALYFMLTYQVILDRTMIGNILNTRIDESIELIHPSLFLFVIFLGIIPSYFVYEIKIISISRTSVILKVLLSTVLSLICIYASSSTWLWFDDNAKVLGGKTLPWSYIVGYARHKSSTKAITQKLLPAATFSNDEKMVVILVIGETARSANFSLYGYQKITNPLLSKSGVQTLQNSYSCSPYTTKSLAFILSDSNESNLLSGEKEPLPSYLKRHGVDVICRSNNWGEPPIETNTYQTANELKKTCKGEDCKYDAVLLTGLRERILSSNKNKIFVVLHQKGSHGPAYYSRYPDEFEKFIPVCKNVELQSCSKEELLNAYDNTIYYNDYVLNNTIDILKSLENRKSVFMYISDHGESLGEYNLYLHGAPYSIAPDVQKSIPFLVWRSYQDPTDQQLHAQQKNKYGHSNIFHSVMGALSMNSDIYKKELDIFSIR